MTTQRITTVQHPEAAPQRDLFKISRSRQEFGIAPNTIRSLFPKGLASYKLGKLVLISRSELTEFIKQNGRRNVCEVAR